MTDKKKGFIWGVFAGIILTIVMIAFAAHIANTNAPDIDPLTHSIVPVDGGGVGGGSVYTPPENLSIPSVNIPQLAPAPMPSISEPAQTAPAMAAPSPQ